MVLVEQAAKLPGNAELERMRARQALPLYSIEGGSASGRCTGLQIERGERMARAKVLVDYDSLLIKKKN